MQSQKFTIGLMIALAVLITIGFFARDLIGPSQGSVKKELLELGFFQFDKPRALKPIMLKDLKGNELAVADGSEQWQLVNFGYMFCPDICPINLRLMSELKQTWDKAGQGEKFDITHITFDPERDTPDRLTKYLDYINPDYVAFTGELENIRKVAQQLSTVFIHEKPDEYGNYFITHSDSIAILNPKGEYVGLFKGPYDKENIIKALKIVLNSAG